MDDALRRFLEDMLATPPFHDWLCPVLESFDEAARTATIRVAAKPAFARWQDSPQFHGGIIACAMDSAAHTAIALVTRRPTPTVNMRVDFTRASSGADILATGRVIHAGRSIGTVSVEVHEPSDRQIAAGLVTFYTRTD